MDKLIELLDIIKLAVALYRRGGYEIAKSKLVEELERRDDKETERNLRDSLDV